MSESEDENGIDLVELENELWRESLRRLLQGMLLREDGAERYLPGPFQAGWQSAIEEVALYIGIDYDALSLSPPFQHPEIPSRSQGCCQTCPRWTR